MSKELVKEEKMIKTILKNYKEYKADPTVITSIGKEEINELRQISSILDTPVKNLMNEKGTIQDHISNNLLSIKTEADKINPNNFDLSPGFFGRLIEKFTGSSALNKYASKFATVKDTIESISESLVEGILLLESDNRTFIEDRERFRAAANSLEHKINYLNKLNNELNIFIEKEEDEDKKKFLKDKVSYDIKAHIIDLQTVHSAAQQGLIALDILIENNKELIKGVERTKNVAIPVLSIGFTIATGLANQKKVIDTISTVNKSTSDIMLQNANMLKTQGVEIQTQATTALLDLEDMKKAVDTLISTVNEVETFKENALPKMQSTINEFNSLSQTLDSKLQKIEHK